MQSAFRGFIKAVSFMGSGCGLTIDTTDVLVRPQEMESPFDTDVDPPIARVMSKAAGLPRAELA